MRCLTLAEALRKNGVNCIFICRDHTKNINQLIKDQKFQVHLLSKPQKVSSKNWLGIDQQSDAQEAISILKSLEIIPDWLIVDHYGIDSKWELILRPYVKKIMVIDDLANRPHDCDVLLDQNYTHKWDRYTDLVSDHCRLLLSPEYAILRPEFLKARKKLEQEGKLPFDPRKVFIFFGGVDPNNFTGSALSVLHKIGDFAPEVVIGASNPHRASIETQMQQFPEGNLHIQTDKMAEVMLKCSWYFGSGGSITWERMCLGLTGVVVPVAENQLECSVTLAKDGFCILSQDLMNILQILSKQETFTLLQEYQKLSFLLVDGLGTEKVCFKLLNKFDHKRLSIRETNESDILKFFLWANDRVVRRNAWNEEAISIEQHMNWFSKKINDNQTKIYILNYGDIPIGQARYEAKLNFWLLNYSISGAFRGNSIGSYLIKLSEEKLKEQVNEKFSISLLRAEVKPDNLASKSCLERSGYALALEEISPEKNIFVKPLIRITFSAPHCYYGCIES